MPDFTPHESAPLNDTPEAKGLAPDPLLARVEDIEQQALNQGLPLDEAQAAAWAQVDQEGAAEKPHAGGTIKPGAKGDDDASKRHGHPHDISVGG